MKKILKIILLIGIFSLVGCGINYADNVLDKLEKKLKNADSYYIEGIMEIMNNEDTYTYNVKVSYKKQDYYRIELVNTLNNHEQVILRNDDGVYVVTPSLNKSFKFQSDWPYNNSQVYLLNSILNDLIEDEDREFRTKGEGYIYTSTVHYPNNKSLVNQKVYLDKDGNIIKTEVVDKDDNVQIVMEFTNQKFNKKFEKNYFELSELLNSSSKNIINDQTKIKESNSKNESHSSEPNTANKDNTKSNSNLNTNSDSSKNENSNSISETKTNSDTTKETVKIDDVIYPMYLPDNTYLTSQDTIDTENGQRLILTFGGDSSFILVEETVNISEEEIVIPVTGEFDFLSDVIGIIGTNSLTWYSNGIEYYMASDSITTSELMEIAHSISILPVSK